MRLTVQCNLYTNMFFFFFFEGYDLHSGATYSLKNMVLFQSFELQKNKSISAGKLFSDQFQQEKLAVNNGSRPVAMVTRRVKKLLIVDF